MTSVKDWAGVMISAQTLTGRVLVGSPPFMLETESCCLVSEAHCHSQMWSRQQITQVPLFTFATFLLMKVAQVKPASLSPQMNHIQLIILPLQHVNTSIGLAHVGLLCLNKARATKRID